jgi:hypothetical protein
MRPFSSRGSSDIDPVVVWWRLATADGARRETAMMKAAQVEKIHDRSWRVALVGSSIIIGQAGCWRVAGAVRGGGDSIRLSLRKSLLAGL